MLDSNSFSSKPAPKWCFEYGANKSVYFGHSMIVKTVVKNIRNTHWLSRPLGWEGWGGGYMYVGLLAKKFGPHVVKKITFQLFWWVGHREAELWRKPHHKTTKKHEHNKKAGMKTLDFLLSWERNAWHFQSETDFRKSFCLILQRKFHKARKYPCIPC